VPVLAFAADDFYPLLTGDDVAHVGHELPVGRSQPGIGDFDDIPSAHAGPR